MYTLGFTFALLSFRCSCLAPKYVVMDASKDVVLNIEGPMCICQGPCCTGDVDFEVTEVCILTVLFDLSLIINFSKSQNLCT